METDFDPEDGQEGGAMNTTREFEEVKDGYSAF